jgi:hypothetical protein
MQSGEISQEIPFIKKLSMGILRQTFSNRDTALIMIKDSITKFYKSTYSDFYNDNSDIVNTAITNIGNKFYQNTFPIMNVTYDVYPDHIGHLESNGCFRCHNDSFKSESGRVISRDCNLCHSIVGQGKPEDMKLTNVRDALEFHHPVDIGGIWKEANCSECHMYLY